MNTSHLPATRRFFQFVQRVFTKKKGLFLLFFFCKLLTEVTKPTECGGLHQDLQGQEERGTIKRSLVWTQECKYTYMHVLILFIVAAEMWKSIYNGVEVPKHANKVVVGYYYKQCTDDLYG